jgi:hypothetical protein
MKSVVWLGKVQLTSSGQKVEELFLLSSGTEQNSFNSGTFLSRNVMHFAH